jgi:FemAB-related protein (PEP-CTERM system-associated)
MNSPSAVGYQHTGWKSVIEKTFGHRTSYLLSEGSENRIEGILPLVQLRSKLFGNFVVSLPYFNYGGICAENDSVARALLAAAIDITKEQRASHIELRHLNHLFDELPVKTAKVSMRLQLTNDSNKLWEALSSKLRSQIRRPEKEGMYAKLGKEEELDAFYKVFSVNMRDLGTPVYGKAFFRNILRQFPESTRICTVYTKQGIAVAAGFLIGFKKVLEIPWASSLRSHKSFSPNMLLYWTSMKYACENGYDTFDFGRSTPGEGTCKFKEQWGAKPVQLFWHYWLRNGGPLPELNPRNPKYKFAIKVWRKLPLSLTKLIGPAIVRSLP